MGHPGLKPRCGKICVPSILSKALGGESISLPFPASRGHPLSLICDPFLRFPKAGAKHLQISLPDLCFILTPPCLALILLSPSYKDYIGPSWIIQAMLPNSGSLIAPAKTLLPCKDTWSQVLGIRICTSLGAVILSTIESTIISLTLQIRKLRRRMTYPRSRSWRGTWGTRTPFVSVWCVRLPGLPVWVNVFPFYSDSLSPSGEWVPVPPKLTGVLGSA